MKGKYFFLKSWICIIFKQIRFNIILSIMCFFNIVANYFYIWRFDALRHTKKRFKTFNVSLKDCYNCFGTLTCWIEASSSSLFIFAISVSLFLFSSSWAAVAPPASSSRSWSSSSSRARSDFCFSDFERKALSDSSSSSKSSIRSCWIELILICLHTITLQWIIG